MRSELVPDLRESCALSGGTPLSLGIHVSERLDTIRQLLGSSGISLIRTPNEGPECVKVSDSTENRLTRPQPDVVAVPFAEFIQLSDASPEAGSLERISQVDLSRAECCLVPVSEPYVLAVPERVARICVAVEVPVPQGKLQLFVRMEEFLPALHEPHPFVRRQVGTG